MDFERERRATGTPLKVDAVLAALDDDDAEQLRQALHDPETYNHSLIARTVTNQTGHRLGPGAVCNWREHNL